MPRRAAASIQQPRYALQENDSSAELSQKDGESVLVDARRWKIGRCELWTTGGRRGGYEFVQFGDESRGEPFNGGRQKFFGAVRLRHRQRALGHHGIHFKEVAPHLRGADIARYTVKHGHP